jgi:hypothetical protein
MEKKKGLLGRILAGLDKKLKEKAAKSGSCCCGTADDQKGKNSCCGK